MNCTSESNFCITLMNYGSVWIWGRDVMSQKSWTFFTEVEVKVFGLWFLSTWSTDKLIYFSAKYLKKKSIFKRQILLYQSSYVAIDGKISRMLLYTQDYKSASSFAILPSIDRVNTSFRRHYLIRKFKCCKLTSITH